MSESMKPIHTDPEGRHEGVGAFRGKRISLAEAAEMARMSMVRAESARAEERAKDARENACPECSALRSSLAAAEARVKALEGDLYAFRRAMIYGEVNHDPDVRRRVEALMKKDPPQPNKSALRPAGEAKP